MSPLVLTFRASVGALPVIEQIIGIIVSALYVVISFYVAFKLFEVGSLEFGKKVSLKNILRRS